jgi:predicted RNase H-like HicB family nuclease
VYNWSVKGKVQVRRVIMRFKIVLEESDQGGYTVYVPSLPGCISGSPAGKPYSIAKADW